MPYTFTGRDGEIRLFPKGNTTGTPYLSIPFVQMDATLPFAKPRPIDPVIVFVGGHVFAPDSPDYEKGFIDPLPFSFSCMVDDAVNTSKLRSAMCNPDLATPWLVGATTWESTKGMGSIILPDGTYRGTGQFFDVKKSSVNMEVVWTSYPDKAFTFGMQYKEVYTPPQTIEIRESPDAVTIAVQGLVYGDIGSISAFTPGIAA